jgi:hypothetical protein
MFIVLLMCHSKLCRKEINFTDCYLLLSKRKRLMGISFCLYFVCVCVCVCGVFFLAFNKDSYERRVIAVNTFCSNSPRESNNNTT